MGSIHPGQDGCRMTARAQAIDFADLADLPSVNARHAHLGILFRGAFADSASPAPPDAYTPAFAGVGQVANNILAGGILRADFAPGAGPVSRVSVRLTGEAGGTLEAYRHDGLLVAADESPGPQDIEVGTTNDLLSVATAGAIAYVLVHGGGDSFTVVEFTFVREGRDGGERAGERPGADQGVAAADGAGSP